MNPTPVATVPTSTRVFAAIFTSVVAALVAFLITTYSVLATLIMSASSIISIDVLMMIVAALALVPLAGGAVTGCLAWADRAQ